MFQLSVCIFYRPNVGLEGGEAFSIAEEVPRIVGDLSHGFRFLLDEFLGDMFTDVVLNQVQISLNLLN